MAQLSKSKYIPHLLTYENESMYLHITPQGCALFKPESSEPYYRIQEPLLLAEGIMTDIKTVHLVVLKTNGELCYTLISGFSNPQTTLIAKLDVRTTKYRRFLIFPQGKMVHIFYAYSHQAIRDLWRIEHRFWNGSTWNSVHMGEVVHPREPLYHVNLDQQGNLHLLTMTFQGRHSLLFTNRFNGTFHIWGSPTETLKIPGEVVDMTSLMTTDNVQHLFWVAKAPNGHYEIRWAQQTNALELTGNWQPSPAPIKTFSPPWRNLGAIEINGVLWLLAHTGNETLLLNDGTGWKSVLTNSFSQQPLKWIHNGQRNVQQTYWLEDQAIPRTPAYCHELGLNLCQRLSPDQDTTYITPVNPAVVPPPVPAFHPETISLSSNPYPLQSLTRQDQVVSSLPIVKETEEPEITLEILNASPEDIPSVGSEESSIPSALEPATEESPSAPPLKDNSELDRLIATVANLEQESSNLNLVLQTMMSKFDQILDAFAENTLRAKQAENPIPPIPAEQSSPEIPLEELEPFIEAMANLEKETQTISQVLQTMLVKQEESDSSLETLGQQVSQLQDEKRSDRSKGGFWNKWIT
ncbi:hypothetical protein Desaci_0605 [Desulfosporosinus acidiphilus SJ4]|uniref:Uncharacterized protein n=1 Tax=Desulfosporosinus acidiphilus (strain DSM 22704 / JCM 16185 / SJ4) TaxID=646529 RepID=I4D1J3_DESAJ|nr:hypothetical protein [Desulfosporosinus acidiphilus]AFM39667.1 hypothetical protein Desaci_0605 [Desulfosporosinus acidiphilus SJ4]